MYKIILVFCLSLAAAQSKYARNDDYISWNKFLFENVVKDYDRRLAFFEEHYTGRIEAALEQKELISDAINNKKNELQPLSILGNRFKACFLQYNSMLPKVSEAKEAVTNCEVDATKKLSDLLKPARTTRKLFIGYLEKFYELNLKNCAKEYELTSANYTQCVTSIADKTNSQAFSSQKTFEKHLEAATCSAKAHIKELLDCIYDVQSRAVGIISEVNFLVNKCLDGANDCKPCEKYTCSESYDLYVDNASETIKNPFLGRDNHKRCLMLNAK